MLGQVDIHGRLCLHEFSHQIFIADIIDEVILGTDIMNAYGFIVDLRENVLRIGQEKIRFCMAKMTGSAHHLIKQVTVAYGKINRCGDEVPLVLHEEMEE